MPRVTVLIDAGYLFKAGGKLLAARDVRREEIRLDIAAIVTALTDTATVLTGRELLRVYWYDAARGGPTTDHRDIADHAHVKLRLGHLNSAGQQKGVDPLIITDMITLARNHACDDMVLLSGDADLVVGVQQAQERGVRVHLLGIAPTRGNQAPSLRQEADTCTEWDAASVRCFLSLAHSASVDARTLATSGSGAVAATPAAGTSLGAPPSVVSDVLLGTVADAVAGHLTDADHAVVASGKPGLVPPPIDRQLLGTAKAMLNTLLSESEKRVLRRLLYERCRAA